MATKDEVNGFLAQFHTKAKVFGITYFGGREKNMNTLADLPHCRTPHYISI